MAMAENRLSWIEQVGSTSSANELPPDARQYTMDLDTSDESIKSWAVGTLYPGTWAPFGYEPHGPVSPDGKQRVGAARQCTFVSSLAFGDATSLRPLDRSTRCTDPLQRSSTNLLWAYDVNWDPSGDSVWLSGRDQGGNGEHDIYQSDLDGNIEAVVDFADPPTSGPYSNGPRSPSLPADGSKIAFVTDVKPDGSQAATNLYGVASALYVSDRDGSNPTPVLDAGDWLFMEYPAFAPDGAEIVFWGVNDAFSYGLFKVVLAAGTVTQLTDSSEPLAMLQATWSPDGNHLAYLRYDGVNPAQVRMMDADGDSNELLKTLPAEVDTSIAMDSLSFRQSSTATNPGPGAFPLLSPPRPLPTTGPETYGPGGGVASGMIPASVASGMPGGASPQKPNCERGRPVNCATGNQWEQLVDISIDGLGGPTVLSRTYNSQAAAASISGSLGRGWRQAFAARLKQSSVPGRLTAELEDGSEVSFEEMPDGSWRAADWVQATLTTRSGGGHTLRLPSHYRLNFDADGKLESQADRNGNVTTLAYDTNGRLVTIIAPSGRQLALQYNSAGLVSEVDGPGGRTVSYEYTGGKLTHVENVDGGDWQYGYDSAGQMTSMTDPRNRVTTTTYDSQHRVISQTDAGATTEWDWTNGTGTAVEVDITDPTDRHTVMSFEDALPVGVTRGAGSTEELTETYTYNAYGTIASKTDGAGETWTFGYDDAGNRTSATDPEGHTRHWAYDDHRNLLWDRLPSGRRTGFEYDGNDNLTATELQNAAGTAETSRVEMSYTSRGELATRTDALDRTTTYSYNTGGDQTQVQSPSGRKTTRTFDANGWIESVTAPKGNLTGANAEQYTTHYARNAFGDVTKTTDPKDHDTEFAYDHNRNWTTVTDAENKQTSTTYDAHNRPIEIAYPDTSTSAKAFDAEGRLTSRTDRDGNETIYEHDAIGRVEAAIDPLDRETHYAYNDAGFIASKTKPNASVITYDYDDAGALTNVDFPNTTAQDLEFVYDQDGATTHASDESGTTAYDYDQFGRPTSVTNGHGDEVGYGYDTAGQMTTVDYPVGPSQPSKTLTRAFSDDGQLESVTDWNAKQTTFDYDVNGSYAGATYANSGVSSDISRDATGTITAIDISAGTTSLAGFRYSHDDLDRVSSATTTDHPQAGTESFDRNAADRLVGAQTQDYDYSAAGSIAEFDDATNGTYDDAGQLTSIDLSGDTYDLDYDQQGNRTSSTPPTGPAATYDYDADDRLRQVNPGESSSPSETYIYDFSGTRASRTQGSHTEHYTWDTQSASLPLLLSDDDHQYIYGPTGAVIAQIATNGTTTYLHQDQLGSTRLLTDATGDVVGSASYSSYGTRTAQAGMQTKLGFAGAYIDALTGFQYNRARYYDPATAQFITRDPLEDQTEQPYAYGHGDPLSFVDPQGMLGIPSPMDVANALSDAGGAVLNKVTDPKWIANTAGKISSYSGVCAVVAAGTPVGLACTGVSGVSGLLATLSSAYVAATDPCVNWAAPIANGAGVLLGGAGEKLIKAGMGAKEAGQLAASSGTIKGAVIGGVQQGVGHVGVISGAGVTAGGVAISTYGAAPQGDIVGPWKP